MGMDRPVRNRQHKSAIIRTQLGDLGVLPDRGTRARGVVLYDDQDLAPVREAARVVAGVHKAGSSSDQLGNWKTQRLPAFRPPALSDLPPLEHHVLPAALLQHRAHGQSRLTAPDDNGVVVPALRITRLPHRNG